MSLTMSSSPTKPSQLPAEKQKVKGFHHKIFAWDGFECCPCFHEENTMFYMLTPSLYKVNVSCVVILVKSGSNMTLRQNWFHEQEKGAVVPAGNIVASTRLRLISTTTKTSPSIHSRRRIVVGWIIDYERRRHDAPKRCGVMSFCNMITFASLAR